MFSACASTGGKAASSVLAPCPMNDEVACNLSHDLESLAYDAITNAQKWEGKLQAFDSWLFNDCEGDGQFEPKLQIDGIELARRPTATLDQTDPPLFRGSSLPMESSVYCIAEANRTEIMNKLPPLHHQAEILNTVPPLKIPPKTANATTSLHSHEENGEAEPRMPKPILRELPAELETSAHDQLINMCAKEMMAKMKRRSPRTQSEWANGSKKVQAWLASNSFFGVNSRRSSLFSYTYPLHIATFHDDAELIQLLISRQADPRKLDSSGRTPLQVAARKCKQGSHRKAMVQLVAVS